MNLKTFNLNFVEITEKKETRYVEVSSLNYFISKLRTLNYDDIKNQAPKIKGIYFWFNGQDLQYIGIAKNKDGLYKRIVLQHLSEKYLEYRDTAHSSKDSYQLENSINRISKDGMILRKGIDKSTFRKKIGRKFNLKPGKDTVRYIKSNGLFKIIPLKDISDEKLELLETIMISFFQPVFNDSKKDIMVREKVAIPYHMEITHFC